MTQQQAADNAQPRMTAQNWGMHETGVVAGIEKRAVLRRIAGALGATIEDIEAERRRIEVEGGAPAPANRLRALAGGLAETPRRFEPQGVRRAEFPLSEGQAVLIFPEAMTPDMYRELADYLRVFLRTHGQDLTPVA